MTEPASVRTAIKSSAFSTFVYSLCLAPFDVVKNTQISSVTRMNPLQTATILVKKTGLKTLWRGLISSSISTFSSNIVYYPCYEYFKPKFLSLSESWGCGFAALASRLIAVITTLPIERLRTSIQGTGIGEFKITFNGLKVTLYRDMIFSFTYFTLYENSYKKLKNDNPLMARTYSSFFGSLISAIITHPFDVIKTKIQTRYCCFNEYDKNTLKAVSSLYKEEGLKGLFTGAQPRISKITIGLVIYMNLYEKFKKL
ncbi:hypothetical protein SteCoe_15119 [Stentor coeruleus]|uniref:ADP/ATP translocase n=1 Tax=Stentor coeruleus TaxID=5963 RepID=A0A1R2C4I4_9CILI|nr:hypothetical protein SteCoe_15119 [Stentor coeruleus]